MVAYLASNAEAIFFGRAPNAQEAGLAAGFLGAYALGAALNDRISRIFRGKRSIQDNELLHDASVVDEFDCAKKLVCIMAASDKSEDAIANIFLNKFGGNYILSMFENYQPFACCLS